MTDGSREIPSSWRPTRIGDLCELKNGRAFKSSDWSAKGLPIVRIQNLNNPNAPFNHYDGEVEERFLIQHGDLLFAWSGTPGTSFGAHIWRGGDAVLNQHIFRMDFDERAIDKSYFKFAINNRLNELIEKAHGGVGLRHVTKGKFEETTIPVPPLREQRRIVAKVEELLSELDRGVEALTIAREQLKAYRQSALKHAFEGKFTEGTRKRRKEGLESPSKLLDEMKKASANYFSEQASHWQFALQQWQEGGEKGKRPSKPGRPADIVPVSDADVAGLPSLPESWVYVRLATLGQIGSGMSVSKDRVLDDPMEVPYLRVANVQRGSLDLTHVAKMRVEKSQLPQLILRKWDVLFNEGGDRDKLGRGWVWEDQINPCITQNHVFRASPYMASEPHAKFISYWGNTFGQDYFNTEGKQTTNLASINKAVLSSFPVPLTSMQEQTDVVREIEDRLSLADGLSSEINAALERGKVLHRSILKRAFAGALVGQDPEDEPATALLERIRGELKGAATKKERTTKNGRKKAA